MLHVLKHTMLAVKIVVGLWNWVYYNLCTLYVLKGQDWASESEVVQTGLGPQ